MTASYFQFVMRLNAERDADIISWLDQHENKTDAVRKAIRKAIEERKPGD